MSNEVKRKQIRRAAAIQRNEKYRAKYERQAQEVGLTGTAVTAYANHKIGIPRPKGVQS